jgi:hypothetical protein
METESPRTAFDRVLLSAGATLPRRDVVDSRIIEQVRLNTGKIIDSQSEVGSWPVYSTAPLMDDTDGDGMPDKWEKSHGLNMSDKNDGVDDADGDGYTNLEEFLNGTEPQVKDK